MSNKEYIIFYSTGCQHSSEILQRLSIMGIRDRFLEINIDSSRVQIPAYIDRVPTIVIRRTRELVMDDMLDIFLGSFQKQKNQTVTDFLPASDGFKGLTDGFSFIDEDGHSMGSMNYVSLDNVHQQSELKPVIPKEDNEKFNESNYDKYISQRDTDLSKLFPRQNMLKDN